jgi:hypothetical protein
VPRRRGQQPNDRSLQEVPNTVPTFLFYDPRTLPDPGPADRSAWMVLDDIQEALGAIPLPRETARGSPSPSVEQMADLVADDAVNAVPNDGLYDLPSPFLPGPIDPRPCLNPKPIL